MPRWLLYLLAVIGGILILTQLFVPLWLGERVENRLTERAGHADVKLRAIPALRLLAGDGDRVEIRGGGFRFDLDEREEDVFDDLDGFSEVDVQVEDFRVGPFGVSDFFLARDGDDEAYTLELEGSASARELSTYAGERIGGPLGGFLGDLAGDALPGGDQPVPVDIRADVVSRGGRAHAREVEGSVAGVPAGPLAEALVDAVVARL